MTISAQHRDHRRDEEHRHERGDFSWHPDDDDDDDDVEEHEHADAHDRARDRDHHRDRDLFCPTCQRLIIVDRFDLRVSGVRVSRCPYPSCAAIVVMLAKLFDAYPSQLYTPAQVAVHFRWRLADDAPLFVFAQGILGLAMTASAWAIHHVVSLPSATESTAQLAQIGIVVGALSLGLPALYTAVVLAKLLLARVRDDRHVLKRVELGLPVERDRASDPGVRFVPAPVTYRSSD